MHCLIVDDDPLICDLLEHFCSKTESISNITISNNGFEAISLINQNNFDVILLDYDLPDLTAKEVLPLINDDTSVIMITANKDFGHESYNYEQIVDFLVKPIEFSRFFKGIQKVIGKKQDPMPVANQLFVKDGNSLVSLNFEDVLFIRSAGNYAELVLSDKKVMTIMTLKELETKLTSDFQRVHRSCIVNVNKVDRINNADLIVNGYEISISSSHKAELMKKIKLLK